MLLALVAMLVAVAPALAQTATPSATIACTPNYQTAPGMSVTCTWSTANAMSVSVTDPAGNVVSTAASGSITEPPLPACGSGLYAVSVDGGITTAAWAGVVVAPLAPTVTVTASGLTLTWMSANASAVHLSSSDKTYDYVPETPNVTTSLTVTSTNRYTAYFLTADPICGTGFGWTANASVQIAITNPAFPFQVVAEWVYNGGTQPCQSDPTQQCVVYTVKQKWTDARALEECGAAVAADRAANAAAVAAGTDTAKLYTCDPTTNWVGEPVGPGNGIP